MPGAIGDLDQHYAKLFIYSSLVAQNEKFLLELGRGFMFVGTQQLIAQVEAVLKEWHEKEE